MKHKVINTLESFSERFLEQLTRNGCEVVYRALEPLSEDELINELQDIDGVLASGERYSEKVLTAVDKLKVISRLGVGYDKIDVPAATRRGIWVTNTPGAISKAVAELSLALMLALLRHIPEMNHAMKNRRWERQQARELDALTVGLVGVGGIGKEVVKLVRGFKAKVIGYDICPDQNFAQETGMEYVTLDKLMAQSDMIAVCVNLNDSSRGLIDKAKLDLMKPSAYIINTSRAPVIVKDALIAKLNAREIAGAGIDVHDTFPCDPDDPLVHLDNVIATPWVAFYTVEALEKMSTLAVSDLLNVLQGERPRHPINHIKGPVPEMIGGPPQAETAVQSGYTREE